MTALAGIPIVEWPGKVFGRWTVVSEPTRPTTGATRGWNVRCRCTCGKETEVRIWRLTEGVTKACFMCARTTHGGTDHPLYNIWRGMISRCYVPSNRSYKWYGANGITVCERWRESFNAFVHDVGPRPSSRHGLERHSNNEGYHPGNVGWATQAQQMRNTRRTHLVTFMGETLCLTDWAVRLGIPSQTLAYRLKTGTTMEQLHPANLVETADGG